MDILERTITEDNKSYWRGYIKDFSKIRNTPLYLRFLDQVNKYRKEQLSWEGTRAANRIYGYSPSIYVHERGKLRVESLFRCVLILLWGHSFKNQENIDKQLQYKKCLSCNGTALDLWEKGSKCSKKYKLTDKERLKLYEKRFGKLEEET